MEDQFYNNKIVIQIPKAWFADIRQIDASRFNACIHKYKEIFCFDRDFNLEENQQKEDQKYFHIFDYFEGEKTKFLLHVVKNLQNKSMKIWIYLSEKRLLNNKDELFLSKFENYMKEFFDIDKSPIMVFQCFEE